MNALLLQRRIPLRTFLLPVLVGSLAVAVAVVGAILVGNDNGVDGVNSFVETLSGTSSSFFGGLGILAPLGFAFAAGVAAAFNPCGFAMLPAYMGLYMGTGDEHGRQRHLFQDLGKALVVGGAVTAGFIVLFGAAGTLIGVGARSAVAGILPWLGLGIGLAACPRNTVRGLLRVR